MYIMKRRVSIRKIMSKVSLLFILLIIGSLLVNYQLSRPVGPAGRYIKIDITPEQTIGEIAQKLKTVELIKSKFWFRSWLFISGKDDEIKIGEYNLPSNVNIYNLVRMITGSIITPKELTIRLIEGWNIKQIDEYLSQINFLTKGDFEAAVGGGERTENLVKNFKGTILNSWPGGSLEGYLFPDTYRVYASSTAEEVAMRMLNNLEKKWQEDWNETLSSRGLTIHKALTLASIIEMEVPGFNDRKLVADIFYKRMKAGIPLQADSTINYITGKKLPAVTAADLQVDSPYNTYKYTGLPPGPISNPGLSSLQAVFESTPNDYWFFLTTPSGQVIYSRNFEEHKAAKIKYLK